MDNLTKLRYWTFKILPLVYDDSLSYYEVLTKVTAKVNELVDSNNAMPQTITDEITKQLDESYATDISNKIDNAVNTVTENANNQIDKLANEVYAKLITAIATDEGTNTFTENVKSGGELIFLNGTLYKVTAVMPAGTSYIVGTNIIPVNISEELRDIKETYLVSNNEHWNDRSTNNYDSGSYLYWKDNLYATTKDIKVNDVLYSNGENQNIKQVTLAKEITYHYNEMHESYNKLKTQINNNNTGSIYERLHGKVIIGLGDSLMIGSREAFGHTWLENIQEQYGAICHNYGVSGSPIAGDTPDAMNQRLAAILDANNSCDYFILEGGANDKNQNIHIGSINSEGTNTVMGAVMYIIKRVRSKYGKNCHILGMTTYHRYDDVNDIGLTEQNYVDAVMLACSTLGVPCFNNYNNAGISLAEPIGTYSNYNTWADVGFTGGNSNRNYHFSKAGYEYLTPIYASFIANGYCNNDAWRTFYTTVDNTTFTKTVMPNGISIITANYNSTNIKVNNLTNHLAYANLGAITFPNGFRLRDVHDIQITTAIQKDGCLVTVSNATHEPFSNGNNYITLNATILYVGTTAPENLSGRTYVTLIGFDQ